MRELIIVKQGQEIVGNRELSDLDALEKEAVIQELKKRYPEDAYTFYSHKCFDGKPCQEVPITLKAAAKEAKKEPAKTEGEGESAGAGDKAKVNANAKTVKEKGKAGKK